MTLTAYLGPAGLTDVGVSFFTTSGTIIGNRTTTGVADTGGGWYLINVTIPAAAASICWDSISTPSATAQEYFAAVNPQPPAGDSALCMVYGFVQNPQGIPAATVPFEFTLVSPAGVKDTVGRLIHNRTVTASTDSSGYIHVLLERNDRLQPTGSVWNVKAPAIGVTMAQTISLQALTFNLAGVV